MLIDSRLDTTRYAITFPKPVATDSFYMCKGCAEFLTSYPREHAGEICDKVHLLFDGFLGFVTYKGDVKSKWISNGAVYRGEAPKVVAVINGIEYLIGVIARCTSHEELLGSLEKLFNAVAVQNGGCLRGGV